MPKVLAGICAAAVLALALTAVLQRTSLAFTLGVAPALPAVSLEPGQEACQTPIRVPGGGAFDRVALTVQGRSAARLVVRETESEQRLATGLVRGARPEQTVRLDATVPQGRTIDVCLENTGDANLAVIGNAEAASRTSYAVMGRTPTQTDMALRFERSARSPASMLGTVADRASLFKPSWAGAWTFWLLAALVLLAVPALLVRAVRGLEE